MVYDCSERSAENEISHRMRHVYVSFLGCDCKEWKNEANMEVIKAYIL